MPSRPPKMPNSCCTPHASQSRSRSWRSISFESRRLARKNGIESHVIFFNQFVELEELTKFIGAADIYITPYLQQEQITSGALAYGFGSGKAVVSTPYWHAAELLADDRGDTCAFQ